MKREHISDAIGGLDERMIEPVARLRAGQDVSGKRKRWLRAATAAACLCVLCAAAVLAYRKGPAPAGEGAPQGGYGMTGDAHMPGGAWVAPEEEPDGSVQDGPERTQPAETGDAAGETADTPGHTVDASQDAFVAPESLFADNAGSMTEHAMMLELIPVGGYGAFYEGVSSAGSDVLAQSLGGELEGAEGFYRLGGHDDLQYVISDNDRTGHNADGERYSLWEFQSFQTEDSYPYRDVLTLIYGVTRGDEIVKIIVTAPCFDNTDAGKRIQEEIGTYEVTDRDAIKDFYEIISGMRCYGSDNWDRIDYGSPDIGADGEGEGTGVREGRYLTLVSGQGCSQGRLKYTGVSGMFYEYSGVAYEPLSRKQAERVEQILGISD